MKNKLMILSLLVAGSAAHSTELDNLIDASGAIVNQIDYGIKIVGAGMDYAPTGAGLSDGTLSQNAHISTEQLTAYNDALAGMQNFQPYGSVQDLLEEQAATELALMDSAIGIFTDVVVEMIAVVEVAEVAAEASTAEEQAEVQSFVEAGAETLQVSQEQVDTYNQSVDDIETHANNASAYIAVASSEDAVAFLQTGAENNNSNAEFATLSYDSNRQWVKMQWQGTNNASAVYLNGGTSYLPDLYVQEAEVLLMGSESDLYLTGPTHLAYGCFMFSEGCE
jgi:hypothetical protein